MSSQVVHKITRREALQRTLLFSSGLLAAGPLSQLRAATPSTDFPSGGLHLLAIGDFGSGNAHQAAVAHRMAEFAKSLKTPLAAVLALGDNFYGKLTPDRFRRHFEEMYSPSDFPCPFYACLGNHDYGPKYDSGQGREKAEMQLTYAKENPSSRWKMPAKWYALELPDAKKPLVKLIVLDGNNYEGMLTPQEKIEQQRFLEAELKKETRATWQWMVSHYPLFSAGVKSDNARLIRQWGDQLKAERFSLYVAGHDHNLQHLQVEDYHPSFVVSGAGGAGLYEIKSPARGYAQRIFGFTHIYVGPDTIQAQFIDTEGNRLHAFKRTRAGAVTVIT
jgi:tartrate-resistant acid phosphatase type 5